MLRPRTPIDAVCLALALVCRILDAADVPEITGFEALIKAGKYVEVSPALQNYVDSHPQSWQALYQLGYVDFRLHRIQDSVKFLCKSLVLNAKFAESHKILAYDLNIMGHQDFAVHELELAIRYDPQSSESHYELGRIDYERGSYLEAVRQFEVAKSLAPNFLRVYHNLGLAYSAIGDNANAVKNFDAGLRMNSEQGNRSAWPLIDYATYFNMQTQFEKARDLLLQAIQIDPSWDQEYDELAKAYRGLGETTEAIEALERAVALNPRKPEYHYVLARLYTQTQQLTRAKKQLAEYEYQKSLETK